MQSTWWRQVEKDTLNPAREVRPKNFEVYF